MAEIMTVIRYQADLNKGVTRQTIRPAFLQGNAGAHKLEIFCVRGSEVVALIDEGVTAYFVRDDGRTVLIQGTVENGEACVVLPAACYAVEGSFELVVQVSGSGNNTSSIYWGGGMVRRSHTEELVDPGKVIPSLDELLAKIATMEEATKRAEAAAAIAESKLDKNLGTAQAGKLLFVADDGSVIPLTIGSGLAIQGGALVNTGGGGSGGESSTDLVFYTADGSVFRTVDDAVFYVKGAK